MIQCKKARLWIQNNQALQFFLILPWKTRLRTFSKYLFVQRKSCITTQRHCHCPQLQYWKGFPSRPRWTRRSWRKITRMTMTMKLFGSDCSIVQVLVPNSILYHIFRKSFSRILRTFFANDGKIGKLHRIKCNPFRRFPTESDGGLLAFQWASWKSCIDTLHTGFEIYI